MIDPDVVFYDLEPEGFARLNRLVIPHVYSPKPELHVLHRNGQVIDVVRTDEGLVSDYRQSFDDPEVRARELLDATGVTRVLMVDADQASSISTAVTAQARTQPTQMQMLWQAQRNFHAHPGVVSVPEYPDAEWPWPAESLSDVGADWWAVVAAWDGATLAFSVLARVEDGCVTEITSLDHFDDASPEVDRATDVIAMSERLGRVGVAVLADVSVFENFTTLADLLGHPERLIASIGLDVLAGVRP